TQLPHQGYLIRTQPNTHLQIGKLGEFILSLGVKRVFVLGAQTPFAVPSQVRLKEVFAAKGGTEIVGSVIYDKDKATFRTEVDKAVDGLKLLAQGKDVNYEGASGPCDFTEQGDIIDCKIRFDRADKGTFKTLKLL